MESRGCLFLASQGLNFCNLLTLSPFVSSQSLIYVSWTHANVMTYDSRSFIKSTVNSSLLYWTSALSVQVVITLSACLHQSNVLYRNFIGAVLSIFANLLLGWAVNEQVRFILTSALQKKFRNISCWTIEISVGHYMLLELSIQNISLSRPRFTWPAPNCCGKKVCEKI